MKSNEMKPFILRTVALSAVAVASATAQERIDLSDYGECRTCELPWVRVAQLGDPSGGGIIEREHSRLVQSESGLYALFAVDYIKLFDSEGRFLRRIGSTGGGPGEYRRIVGLEFSGDSIILLDYDGARTTVLAPNGNVLRSWQLPVGPGPFRVVGTDSIVVGFMGRTPEGAGYPLHLVAFIDGDPRVIRRFGSETGEWNAARQGRSVVLGRSEDAQAIWHGSFGRLHFEKWHIDGHLARQITWDPKWFSAEGAPQTAPRPYLVDFGVDHSDRLWVVTHVLDQSWRRDDFRGREVPASEMDDMFDSRIDIFDLRSGSHLGTTIWNQVLVRLIKTRDGLALYRSELSEEMVPEVGIYRLGG